ncbi:MAG TPA: SDR family oxidoreductase [Thermomicrobiales bacterium]|nr:SDR family oxidoreductase [Thermomicrobiales bacterium]
MILVVGATGLLGSTIVHRLLADGHNVRVLVRPQSNFQPLVDAGATTVFADLKAPETLSPACQGVDTVITTANSAARGGDDTVESVDLQGNRALIEAAEQAGVRHFIFVSALGADPDSPVPFLSAKGAAESQLRASGMDHTILEPNVYLDIWFPMIVAMRLQQQQPVLLIGEGQRKHSFIAMNDVARYAVAAVSNPAARNQTLVLGGPEAVSWRDIIATTERMSNDSIPVENIPVGQTLPDLPDVVSGLMTSFEMFDSPIDMHDTARTFDVPPTSHEQWIQEFFGRA